MSDEVLNVTTANGTDLGQRWFAWETEVLPVLQPQMTRATYDTIIQGTMAFRENGRILITAPSDMAKDWLENRLNATIKKALVPFVGNDVAKTLSFIVAPSDLPPSEPVPTEPLPAEPLPAATSPTAIAVPTSAASQLVPTADELNFINSTNLYASKKEMGYWMFDFNYDNQFWPIFLRTNAYHLKRRLEDFWLEEFSKPEERDLNDPANHWTSPFRVSYGDMVEWVGVVKLAVVQGGENECYHSRLGHTRQDPLRECCGRYAHHDWRETEPGCHQCFYWRPGLLQRLYDLGLIAIEIQRLGPHPRNYRIYIQVWRMLPFLTPLQMSILPSSIQQNHKNWIRNFGRHFNGLSYSQWESWTFPNHTPLLPGYKDGQKLFGQPEPNPFLLPRSSKGDIEAHSLLPCGNKDDDLDHELDDDGDATA